jgi:hypothetical protein
MGRQGEGRGTVRGTRDGSDSSEFNWTRRQGDKGKIEAEAEVEAEVKRQLVGFSPNQVATDGTWRVRNKLLIFP